MPTNRRIRAAIQALLYEELRKLPGLDRVRDLSDPGPGIEEDALREVPLPPVVAFFAGLYGIPHPNNPRPDGGVLWAFSEAAWTAATADDWSSTFPYPPGLQAGNIVHENAAGNLVSWNWRPAGGDALSNSVKYCADATNFTAWIIAEQTALSPTPAQIYNGGRLLTAMPAGYACIGACVNGGHLFAVGLNAIEDFSGWVASGYVTTFAPAVSFFTVSSSGYTFEVGETVRLAGQVRTITSRDNTYYPEHDYFVDVDFSPAIPVGTSIEESVVGFGQTRVFAIAVEADANGVLSLAAGAVWVDLAAVGATGRRDWMQQFIGNPDGDAMIGLYDEGSQLEIFRIELIDGPTPSANVTTEVVTRVDGWHVDSTSLNTAGECIYTVTPQADEILESVNCVYCPNLGPDALWNEGVRYTPGNAIEWLWRFEFLQGRSKATRPTEASVLIAVDYLADGTEARLTIELDYSGHFLRTVVNEYELYNQRYSGFLQSYALPPPNPPDCPTGDRCDQFSFSGDLTRVGESRSRFGVDVECQVDFTANLAVNGGTVATLGSMHHDWAWSGDDATRTGFDRLTEVFVPDPSGTCFSTPNIPEGSCVPGGEAAVRPIPPTQLSNSYTESDGTVVPLDCTDTPDYDYTTWTLVPLSPSYEYRRDFNVLEFVDVRAGVYVLRKRHGAIYDLFGRGQTSPADDTFLPYRLFSDTDVVDGLGGGEQESGVIDIAGDVTQVDGAFPGSWATITAADYLNDNVEPLRPAPGDFLDLGGGVHGAASKGARSLVQAVMPIDGGAWELRVVTLTDPDGDPIALSGIAADEIGGIGAV